jgi:hypothetical protein
MRECDIMIITVVIYREKEHFYDYSCLHAFLPFLIDNFACWPQDIIQPTLVAELKSAKAVLNALGTFGL